MELKSFSTVLLRVGVCFFIIVICIAKFEVLEVDALCNISIRSHIRKTKSV